MKKLFYATLAAVALSVSVGASVVGAESAKAAHKDNLGIIVILEKFILIHIIKNI